MAARTEQDNWCCYLIMSLESNKTYIGSSNDCEKRLYNHNNTKAGAKYTKGQTWSTTIVVSGFENKRACLSFEAGWKKTAKRRNNQRFYKEHICGYNITYTDCTVINRIYDLFYFVKQFAYCSPKFVLDTAVKLTSQPVNLCITSNLYDLSTIPWPWFVKIN
jgi:predicted GIY-YIG superfamily endonuclease